MEYRFNKQVYWPKWSSGAIVSFLERTDSTRLFLSDHAEDKLEGAKGKSQIRKKKDLILKYIEGPKLSHKNVFEFYLGSDMSLKKVCHREKLFDTNYDIILVIAKDNKIVTFYLNKSNYVHSNLNIGNYFRGE